MIEHSDKERQITAHHEAGHAVATWLVGYGPEIEHITIVSTGDFLGVLQSGSPLTNMEPEFDNSPEVLEALENDVVILYAGPSAQKRYSPSSWHDFHGAKDFSDARDLVSRHSGGDIKSEADLHNKLIERAELLVTEHWTEIEALAGALLERKELSGRKVVQLLETFTGKAISRSRLFDYVDPNSVDPHKGLVEE